MQESQISGNIVDVVQGTILPGTIHIQNGKITAIEKSNRRYNQTILPGLIDAHVHIESSMTLPSAFGAAASVHGTLGVVCDPHEIANVLGIAGIDYMLENAAKSPIEFHFGAPSCVPASQFETSGAILDADAVASLLTRTGIGYLSEMMNFPGVIHEDPQVMAKLQAAKRLGLPIDGHAPGLRGDDLRRYVAAGITTDHETLTLEEGREKIDLGMKIIIRSGSAADSLVELLPLLAEHPDMCMYCTDDQHPDSLKSGHIDRIVRKALKLAGKYGYSAMDVLRSATLNPVRHYGLKIGLLQPGDPADFIVIDDLDSFRVEQTFSRGRRIAENGRYLLPVEYSEPINRFHAKSIATPDIVVRSASGYIRVIEAIDHQVFTGSGTATVARNEPIQSDITRDLLKLVVVNRYFEASPAVAFVRNFGLKRGAIASCIAHDSHNIIAVGADDASICKAVNAVIEARGGISFASGEEIDILPLPVAGLMSVVSVDETAEDYLRLTNLVKDAGSTLESPFMTLSFMALTVIPELKLSDRGLFDGKSFRFCKLEA